MTVRQLITELLALPMDSRITAVNDEGVDLPIVGVDAGYQDSHARPVALVLGPDMTAKQSTTVPAAIEVNLSDYLDPPCLEWDQSDSRAAEAARDRTLVELAAAWGE